MASYDSEFPKSDWAQKEEEILKFWADEGVFEKTLTKNAPKGMFVFYEGPPTSNGRPGIHHLESRAFKDALPRYKTMQGYHVPRRGGWDTHGLPVEIAVEKELGLSSKREVEDYGIAAFNEACKKSVWTYVSEWEAFTRRIGYWVDLDDAYVTYRPDYMESVWSILKHVANRDLLYKDYKVLPWCPRCGTALSSHELAQGYKDIKDLSVTAKFKVAGEDNTYFLAWTTTPWTLPGNVGLAVGEDIAYVKINKDGEHLWLAKERLETIEGEYEVEEEKPGSDLAGTHYEPIFPYLATLAPEDQQEALERAYQVYPANFVTTEDGTGIVHTAVMYGQDDFELGTKVGLPKVHLVSPDGHFVSGTDFLQGLFVKDVDTDVAIIKHLAKEGHLFAKAKYEHSYPHCWRCKTPLIYYARDSWYIAMSKLRSELVSENEKINWEPAHIREGRFGEWLREVKDWALSRERFWGTPLPVWHTEDGERVVIGSRAELRAYTKKSGNIYFAMRHGQAESNLEHRISNDPKGNDPLTEKGKEQVREAIAKLRDLGIDLIIASPYMRTTMTARMLQAEMGLSDDQVIFDERIGEFDVGDMKGQRWSDYAAAFDDKEDRFDVAPEGGESRRDLKRRCGDFLYDIERTYQDKTILFVSHYSTLRQLYAVAHGHTIEEVYADAEQEVGCFENAEFRPLDFVPLPHDANYAFDIHRPYIDEIELVMPDGRPLVRTPEVIDVWFDSGAMPFAQDHYPFENTDRIEGDGYPADFISEAIDQTRGWFYTLHAIGVLMGRGHAYKNVVCLGHILDAEGKKMSKSLGNIVSPWEVSAKYGVDPLRFWMYSVNQPGDSKNFDPKTVEEIIRKVFNLLLNSVRFYEMFADDLDLSIDPGESPHVLDQWVLAATNKLVREVTDSVESYKLLEPTRAIREHIADISQWYVRRSRDRFKGNHVQDRAYATATLRAVLETMARLLAPFTPFLAEEVYRRVGGTETSVHLSHWPKDHDISEEILVTMGQTRDVVSRALEARAKAGIKVRQPLGSCTIVGSELPEDYVAIIKEEVNVKNVVFSSGSELEVTLDTTMTPLLEREGEARDLMRAIQEERKKMGLTPDDRVRVVAGNEYKDATEMFADDIKATAGVDDLSVGSEEGTLEVTKHA